MGASFSIQGISMSTYGSQNYLLPSYNSLLSQETIDGANYTEISSLAQIDLSTGAITDHITTNSDGSTSDETASFASIGPAIAAAQAQGLNVMLKPQIGATDPSVPGGFGNLTDPNEVISNPTAFFASYKAYILQWATLAQQYGVPILSIGNEMLAATKPEYTSYWNDIIASVRQVYSGQLTYSALLPLQTSYTAGNEAQQIQFWSKLDFAGFDVYPSLTKQLDPTVAQLDSAWQNNVINNQPQSYVQSITALAQSIGKPVIFTETGVASFPGANDRFDYNDNLIGASTTASDYAAQANWWQSFFDTWAANKPTWLAGIFAWDNDPGATTGPYYADGYGITGKPAELILSSWFGGKDYIAASQSMFQGSTSNDQIYLYGPNGNATSLTQAQSFSTIISVSVDGTIIGGKTPTVHFYVNGLDEGAHTLQANPSGYVDNNGVSFSSTETFTISLTGLVSISQLKMTIDSPVNVGGPENSQTYISAVSVDGTALTNATYTPIQGSPQQLAFTAGGQYDGGSELIDASPWNSALASRQIGSSSDPLQVNGGGGTDAVHLLGNIDDYSLSGFGTNTIYVADNGTLNQNAVLNGIGSIDFADGSSISGITGNSRTLSAGPGLNGTDSIYGGAGSDTLNGTTTRDGTSYLIAGSGANIVNGGAGYDTLVGGGHSVLNAGAASQQLLGGYEVGASDTLNAGSGSYEFLATVMGANVLNAGTGVGDFIIGGGGADTLNGSLSPSAGAIMVAGAGANVLLGGVGADTLVGGGQSLLVAGSGSGQILVGGYSLGAHDTLNAGSSNAVMGVLEGNNLLEAGSGNAVLYGGAGDDLLEGGGGNGVLIAGTGQNTLQAGSGADTLVGGGDSLLLGGSGIYGNSILAGGFSSGAHDTLKAGSGYNEILAVTAGANQLFADSTSSGKGDVLYAGTGNDTLYGAGYGNSAIANQGGVNGQEGVTGYVVGLGNSTVLGGAGNDYVTVVNGAGQSSIDGGGGANIVDFAGYTANQATISTGSNGVTTITFAGSTQTAALSHVGTVLFEGTSAVTLA